MMFRFAFPPLLGLLLVIVGWLFLIRRRKPAGITYSLASSLAEIAGSSRPIWIKLPLIFRTGCLVLLILAAARPQLFDVSREIRSIGVDIMLALDTSGSMRALDFRLNGQPVSRLAAIKRVVGDFIRKRETDRIGLVVFGRNAFTQSPLTMDKGLLLNLVDKIEAGMVGDKTDLGAALAIGAKRLKDLKAKSRILIVMTDGRHNSGDLSPVQAAQAVRAIGGIKIYTIGVGGKGPAPFEVKTPFGPGVVHRRVDLDETTLEKVAGIGGGAYFRAEDSRRLQNIYERIDREEKTEVKIKEFFHFRELYPYFLVPALIFLGVEILLKATLLRVIP